jgi:hypothetical protein
MQSSCVRTLAVISCLLATPVLAQPAPSPSTAPAAPSTGAPGSCKAQVADKKLAGAALNSFMKKCETDATKACGVQAGERKLAGAAKTSFTKKCVSDAVGT